MPRLAQLRIGALANLAEQLRFAPRDALRRQMERIETLAGEISPELNYPEDWVVHRITGYRPGMTEPATFPGDALLGDLSALLERLSEEAEFHAADFSGDTYSVDALCQRWSVSRKTIDRYRRRGLVAHRVRAEGGVVRLLFTARVVEDFEARTAGRLHKARDFHRAGIQDEARLVAIAGRAARRYGWSLAETVRRLSRRSDAGREAIRSAIVRADAASDSPVFRRRTTLDRRTRRVIWRAARRGAPIRLISDRFDRSAASVHRIINEHRAELLRSLDLSPFLSPNRGLNDFERSALLQHPSVFEARRRPAAETIDEFVDAARTDPIPNRHVEQTLAAAHRLLLRQAAERIAELSTYNPAATTLDEIETRLRRASILRGELVRSQRRLALTTIAGRFGELTSLSPHDAIRVHRAAMDALIAAAVGFDPEKGGRLAGAAGLLLNRALASVAVESPASGQRARRAATTGVRLDDWTKRLSPWEDWLTLPRSLADRLSGLEEKDRQIVEVRFGLGPIPPRTLEETAALVGLSRAETTRRERAAIRALRALRARAGDESTPE